MGINAYVDSYLPFDFHTETAGATVASNIDEEVPGQDGKRLALVGFNYIVATTPHTLSVMHCGSLAGSRNSASAAAAAAQKVLNVNTAPTDPAGDAAASLDIIAYKVTGGAWEFNTISALSTKAITLTNNIAVAVESGAPVRIFGELTNGYSFKFALPIGTTHYEDTILMQAPYKGDPLYVSIDNATTAGKLNNLLFAYINK